MFRSAVLLLSAFFFVVGLLSVTLAAADGKALYEGKCLSCHGPNADGKDKDGKDKQKIADMYKIDISKLNLVKNETVKKSDAELAKIITDGIKDTKMKGYSDKMTSDEIASVVKYIRSLKK